MEVTKYHLYNNLNIIAIEQLAQYYELNGYTVEREKQIGEFKADLLVSNEKEKIIIEVKTKKSSKVDKDKLAKFADYINTLDEYKFKIVVARPPKEKKIHIPEFDSILREYILGNIFNEIDILSNRSIVKEVEFISIQEIHLISFEKIQVVGNAYMEVLLHFGEAHKGQKDGEEMEGAIMDDSYPFDFDLILKFNKDERLIIGKINKFEIDTSSFYE